MPTGVPLGVCPFHGSLLLCFGLLTTIVFIGNGPPDSNFPPAADTVTVTHAPVLGAIVPIGDEHIDPSSDLYWKLPGVRAELLKAVQAANVELENAVKAIPSKSGQNQTISRAIIVYLPPDSPKYVKQLKAHYLSIAVMRTSQTADMRTDLIIFTTASEVPKIVADFGCLQHIRISRSDAEQCVVLPHAPLSTRVKQQGAAIPPVTSHPSYIDSMLVLAEFSEGVSQYDYLLRTDLDTFIVPAFADWALGPNTAIATGRGGYGHQNANHHLSWLMRDQLKLTDGGLLGIGSTWYGHSQVMVASAKLTIAAMDWLHTQEFSDYEKFHAGTDSWPHWHWPVTLLYGGHIAVNQIPKDKVIQTAPDVVELDFGTSSVTPTLLKPSIKHMHCWHSEDFFSKFQFEAGKYAELNLTEYANMTTAQGYAAVVAVSSDRLTMSEFRDYVGNSSKMSSNEWKRLVKSPIEMTL